MQIVIDIPEDLRKMIFDDNKFDIAHGYRLAMCVKNGTPLPNGHGKIIDADKIEWFGCVSEQECTNKNIECKDCKRAECDKRQVDAIPAILEADGGAE